MIMENSNYLIFFVALTSIAFLIQAGMLVGMYLAMRKTGARMEALADEVKTKLLPTAETAQAMMIDLRPKIENILTNASDSSSLIRAQMQRMDAVLNDILDRTRLQVIRADELLTRTIDRVENTTEMVHKTVVSPVRQISGLVQGVTTGLEFLIGGKRNRDGSRVAQDEMFI
jgi:hypothetical protein